MKDSSVLFLLFLFLTFSNSFAQFQSENMELKSIWQDLSFEHETMNARYNSIWGYHDPVKEREYAILGGQNGTYFIEVTNPDNPVMRAYVPGALEHCTWREYKNYGHYAYLISDDPGPNRFQIVDMSYLPDSVQVVYDDDKIFARSHTLYIDGDKLYCGSVKTINNMHFSMAVYSLKDPRDPKLLRVLNQDYPNIEHVHDMFVRNDTIYASAGFQGLYVMTLTQDTTFSMIGSITNYDHQGYNHSSWLTPDGKTLVFTDEVPANLPVKIADVSDLNNIRILSNFRSQYGPTPHNPHIVGDNILFLSYYEDGVQVFDISNPYNPVRIGFLDTHPQNENVFLPENLFNGCWGVYPFLPSETILASDRQNGLFVMKTGFPLSAGQENPQPELKVYPNPFTESIKINFYNRKGKFTIKCYDLYGRVVYLKNINLQLENNRVITLNPDMKPGIYFLNINGEGLQVTEKIIKH